MAAGPGAWTTAATRTGGTGYRVRELRYTESEPYFGAYVQWKPSRDLSVRVDVSNLTDAEERRRRDIYAGPRDSAPLSLRETYSQTRGSWLFPANPQDNLRVTPQKRGGADRPRPLPHIAFRPSGCRPCPS